MPAPFVLVQLSDPHVGAEWADVDPVARLGATVDAVRALRPLPDAVLVSGDLADHGAESEYLEVRRLLSAIGVPVYVVAGNHDDPAALGEVFSPGGDDRSRIEYSTSLGPLQLVVLDTSREGKDGGELGPGQLAWLDAQLSTERGKPTVVAMHHPPVVTGVPAFDAIGLADADRRALGEVLGRHPQVRRVVGGHFHRALAGELGGRTVVAAPSTYLQLAIAMEATGLETTSEPPGFLVHSLHEGQLTSHVASAGPPASGR